MCACTSRNAQRCRLARPTSGALQLKFLFFLIGVLCPLAGSAQSGGATLQGTATEPFAIVLEEVVITAQRRSEREEVVPIATTVFSAREIAGTGAFSLNQLGEYVPNVFMSPGATSVHIRGVGAASRNIGFDTRVGIYLDGVYLGQSLAGNPDLVDLDHVEVLRGPQGTLFGKNAVAGAILLVSAKPERNFAADASANAFSRDGLELTASANIPLGGSAATRVYLSNRQQDGYLTNVFDPDRVPSTINFVHPTAGPIFGIPLCDTLGGALPAGCVGGPLGPSTPPDTNTRLGDSEVSSYRAQLAIWPGNGWELNLSVDGLSSDEHPTVIGEPLSDAFGSVVDRFAPGFHEVSISHHGKRSRDVFGTSAHLDYAPENGYRLRSISAYREVDGLYTNDTDGSTLDAGVIEYTDDYRQLTQEVQFISPDAGRLRYVAGVYYFQQDAHTGRIGKIQNAGWILGLAPGDTIGNHGEVETESVALYANGTYDLNDRWSLGLGLRYTHENRSTSWHLDGSAAPPLGIGTTPPEGYTDSISDDDLSPVAHIAYLTKGGVNLFARYATGYKSGGFNVDFVGQADLEAGLDFEPETVDSYELGMKGYFLDRRLYLSAAAFLALYDDFQVNQFFDLGFDPKTGTQATSIRITNAARVDTRGVELEAEFLLNANFSFTGFVGLLDATFDDFPGGTSRVITDPEVPGGIKRVPVNAAGNRIPEAPELTGGLGIRYQAPLSGPQALFEWRLDLLYADDYFTGVENEKLRTLTGTHPATFALDFGSFGVASVIPYGYVSATTTINGRIGLRDHEGRWGAYLWGRNLTDEDAYVNFARDFLGNLWATPRTPRTIGLELSYHY